MEEQSPLLVPISELLFAMAVFAIPAIFIVVAMASYKRCRLLSRYSVPHSLLIATLAGLFPVVWLIASFANRDQLRHEWDAYRRNQGALQRPFAQV